MASSGTRIIKSTLPDLYDARIKRAWLQGYGEPEHEFEPFYVTGTSTTQDERSTYISGLGTWPQKPLGDNVAYDSIWSGYDTILTHYTYALAFTLEQETVEDDLQGLLGQQLSANLAQMGRYTAEVLAAAQFNAPTTAGNSPWMPSTDATGGGDGVAMLSTSHPILSGGVYPNKPSTDADISIATLQAAITNLAKTQNARGYLWPLEAASLVIPPDSEWVARELLESQQVPYSADNTVNTIRGRVQMRIWRYLTDTNAWFVMAGKPAGVGSKGIATVMFWRVRPEFDRDNVFDSGDRRYKGRMRLSFGRWDWRGWYGSTGSS